ncbi:MAG: SEC-C domain-containing protein [Rhodospirillales bacterium]|nr:SEC-C domain-containing protein [Rhodospirillales bacterium]
MRVKQKIGRNSACPCGSGKKYKKCHGSIHNHVANDRMPKINDEKFKVAMRQAEAQHKQRIAQQGHGNPITSFISNGYRVVFVGNTYVWAKAEKWMTFHDFLMDFIAQTLGREWGAEEMKKPLAEMHPVLKWHHYLQEAKSKARKSPLGVNDAPMTGAAAAYLGLSYNLYLLAHNTEIQKELIRRLKDKRSFHGAYYESYVAASFIKAGFDLEFENERDGSTTHCEFTATSRKTGKKYSVEAKARHVEGVMGDECSEAPPDIPRVHRHLHRALKKKANHTRVIFIDVNVPDDENKEIEDAWLKSALQTVRKAEDEIKIDGQPAPPAYVFLTNHPYEYELESHIFRWGSIGEGYRIPDYKHDWPFISIREFVEVRKKHQDMHDLMWSLKDHYAIPSTFNGEIPEYVFGHETGPQLIIGNKYLVPSDKAGHEEVGVLTSACVSEPEKKIYASYTLESGKNVICTCPMTDGELAAYQRQPETFFGQYTPKMRNRDDPISLFDWMLETYKHTSKAKLLEFMKEAADFEELKNYSQEDLAAIYCERCVYGILAQNKKTQKA